MTKCLESDHDIGDLRRQAATLEAEQGMTSEAAKWITAMNVFVRPDEREQFFEGGQLKPKYCQVTFACESGLVVTFHHDKKSPFTNLQKMRLKLPQRARYKAVLER